MAESQNGVARYDTIPRGGRQSRILGSYCKLAKILVTEERCSLQPFHTQARLGFLSNCAHPLST